MYGYWTTNNLTNLIRVFSKNKEALDTIEGGLAYITVPLQKMFHWFNRNTQQGSRKNIAAHYDIGNDLFKIMLDETMMYSSAIFSDENMSLYDAQIKRLDVICKILDIKASE